MTTTIRRGPSLKRQATNTKQGAKNAGLKLPADYTVDNNADITCQAPKLFTGLGRGSYQPHWGEATYIQREDQGMTTWVEIQPKETVLVECDRSMVSRAFSLHTPARAVGVPVYSVADQNLTMEVAASPAVVRDPNFKPATKAQRDEALKVQRQTFGDLRPGAEGAIRGCDIGKAVFTSNKKQIKSRELDRALSAAFSPRAARASETLSLDTNQDSSWSPTSEGPMEQISAEEQELILQEAQAHRLDLLFRTISSNQKQALILKSEGKTTREIGAIQGISHVAVAKSIKKAQATAKSIWGA